MTATADQTFSSARSELPMIYVLLTLATIELMIAHQLVGLWSVSAARLLSAITLLGVLQIVAMVLRIKHRPTLVTGDGLVIRSAKGFEVALPWIRIASVEPIGFGPVPSGNDVTRAALLAHPNVHVTAREAFTVKRFGRSLLAKSITLRVDQPDALVAAAEHYIEHDLRSLSDPRLAIRTPSTVS